MIPLTFPHIQLEGVPNQPRRVLRTDLTLNAYIRQFVKAPNLILTLYTWEQSLINKLTSLSSSIQEGNGNVKNVYEFPALYSNGLAWGLDVYTKKMFCLTSRELYIYSQEFTDNSKMASTDSDFKLNWVRSFQLANAFAFKTEMDASALMENIISTSFQKNVEDGRTETVYIEYSTVHILYIIILYHWYTNTLNKLSKWFYYGQYYTIQGDVIALGYDNYDDMIKSIEGGVRKIANVMRNQLVVKRSDLKDYVIEQSDISRNRIENSELYTTKIEYYNWLYDNDKTKDGNNGLYQLSGKLESNGDWSIYCWNKTLSGVPFDVNKNQLMELSKEYLYCSSMGSMYIKKIMTDPYTKAIFLYIPYLPTKFNPDKFNPDTYVAHGYCYYTLAKEVNYIEIKVVCNVNRGSFLRTGTRLLAEVEKVAWEELNHNIPMRIHLEATCDAVGFYKKCGYNFALVSDYLWWRNMVIEHSFLADKNIKLITYAGYAINLRRLIKMRHREAQIVDDLVDKDPGNAMLEFYQSEISGVNNNTPDGPFKVEDNNYKIVFDNIRDIIALKEQIYPDYMDARSNVFSLGNMGLLESTRMRLIAPGLLQSLTSHTPLTYDMSESDNSDVVAFISQTDTESVDLQSVKRTKLSKPPLSREDHSAKLMKKRKTSVTKREGQTEDEEEDVDYDISSFDFYMTKELNN